MTRPKPVAALELQKSETTVVHAASRIFAALVASGRVTEATRAEQIRFAIHSAIQIALETDRILESDDERGGSRGHLGPLG
jgi:hypothetical protein